MLKVVLVGYARLQNLLHRMCSEPLVKHQRYLVIVAKCFVTSMVVVVAESTLYLHDCTFSVMV